MDKHSTRMIFRTWPDEEGGDAIALMPDKTELGGISSYQRVGQHGTAHPDLITDLDPATPEQVAELRAELERIGYRVEEVT